MKEEEKKTKEQDPKERAKEIFGKDKNPIDYLILSNALIKPVKPKSMFNKIKIPSKN